MPATVPATTARGSGRPRARSVRDRGSGIPARRRHAGGKVRTRCSPTWRSISDASGFDLRTQGEADVVDGHWLRGWLGWQFRAMPDADHPDDPRHDR